MGFAFIREQITREEYLNKAKTAIRKISQSSLDDLSTIAGSPTLTSTALSSSSITFYSPSNKAIDTSIIIATQLTPQIRPTQYQRRKKKNSFITSELLSAPKQS